MVPGELSKVIPCRSARPLRGRICASKPAGIARQNPAGTSARAPGKSVSVSRTAAYTSAPAAPSVMYAGTGKPSPSGKRLSVTRTGALSLRDIPCLRGSELGELGFEVTDVVERTVDAREPNVGDLIESLEGLHQLLADHRRRHFVLAAREQLAFE